MKRNDNRGSSILMVILVAAGIGVMAAIALWVSLRNVQMKTTDAEIKESFYSAEGVLEQVKAGVKEKAEAAYKEAVTKDLERPAGQKTSRRTLRILLREVLIEAAKASMILSLLATS